MSHHVMPCHTCYVCRSSDREPYTADCAVQHYWHEQGSVHQVFPAQAHSRSEVRKRFQCSLLRVSFLYFFLYLLLLFFSSIIFLPFFNDHFLSLFTCFLPYMLFYCSLYDPRKLHVTPNNPRTTNSCCTILGKCVLFLSRHTCHLLFI